MPVLVSPYRFAPAGAGYAAEVLADSPIGYWRQGDPSGTTMTDSSGNARHGTYTASPTLGTTGLLAGDSDTAVAYNGTTQYALVADDNSLDSLTTFTVEAIIKASSVSGTPQIVARDGGSGNRHWQFRLSAGTLQFVKIAGGVVTASSAATLSTGTTYHVAATYDGSNIRLYIDGAANGTPPSATGNLGASTQDLQFAMCRSSTSNNPNNFFNGVIDEVAVYGSALSAVRLAAHNAAR